MMRPASLHPEARVSPRARAAGVLRCRPRCNALRRCPVLPPGPRCTVLLKKLRTALQPENPRRPGLPVQSASTRNGAIVDTYRCHCT